MYLERLYDETEQAELISSAYEFSRKYLGKAPSYYSVPKARQLEAVLALFRLSRANSGLRDAISKTASEEGRSRLGSLMVFSRDVEIYREARRNNFR